MKTSPSNFRDLMADLQDALPLDVPVTILVVHQAGCADFGPFPERCNCDVSVSFDDETYQYSTVQLGKDLLPA